MYQKQSLSTNLTKKYAYKALKYTFYKAAVQLRWQIFKIRQLENINCTNTIKFKTTITPFLFSNMISVTFLPE